MPLNNTPKCQDKDSELQFSWSAECTDQTRQIIASHQHFILEPQFRQTDQGNRIVNRYGPRICMYIYACMCMYVCWYVCAHVCMQVVYGAQVKVTKTVKFN